MISKSDLKKTNELFVRLYKLESIVREFESTHVKLSSGLVEIYNSTHATIKLSDNARFFHDNFKTEIEILNDEIKILIKQKIQNVKDEISEYIYD